MATIATLTNTHPGFYTTLGPYLASREVARFVGDSIWDDDSKTWYVLKNGQHIAGFIAVTLHGRRNVVESMYLTTHGDRQTATRLVATAVKHHGQHSHLHATVRHEHTYAYEAAGFTPVGETKHFTKLVRPATVTQDDTDA